MATSDPIGAQIFIGPVTAAATASAYAALSYVEINDVESLPDIGAESNGVTWTRLKDGLQQTDKGSINPGGGDLMCFLNNTDAGQLAAIAASKVRFAYAFKVIIPDGSGPSAANSTFYFHAKVMSARMTSVQGDSKPRRKFTLALSKVPLEVPTV